MWVLASSAMGSLPQLWYCSLQQMSSSWWSLRKWQTRRDNEVKRWRDSSVCNQSARSGSGPGPKLMEGLQCAVKLARLLLVPGLCFCVHVDSILPQLVSLALVLAVPMSSYSGRLFCYCSSLWGSKGTDRKAFKSAPLVLKIKMQLSWNWSVPISHSVSSAFSQLLLIQFQLLFSADWAGLMWLYANAVF